VKRYVICSLFLCAAALAVEPAAQPKIYVSSGNASFDWTYAAVRELHPEMGGPFDMMSAAFKRKHVPAVVVAEKDQADYILMYFDSVQAGPAGYTSHTTSSSSKNGSTRYGSSTTTVERTQSARLNAAVRLVDAKTDTIVWTYSYSRWNPLNGNQSAYESVAKHLKTFLEGK